MSDDVDACVATPALAVPEPPLEWSNASLAEALDWGAANWGEHEAIVHGRERLSFGCFARRVRAFARGLVAMGVAPGERVALWMGDRPEWLVARWAVPLVGAVLVPVNTRLRDADLRFVLADSQATTLILQDVAGDADLLAMLAALVPDLASQPRGAWRAAALPALRRVVGLCAAAGGHPRKPPELPASLCRFEQVERCGADHLVAAALACAPGPEAAQWVVESATESGDAVLQARMQAVPADAVAQLIYTFGAGAQPRGVLQSHGALLQNAANAVECIGLTSADRFISCVPLFTVQGTSCVLANWIAGMSTLLLDGFTPTRFCELVERERATATFFVDTMVQDLRGFDRLADYELSSLRTGAGAQLAANSFAWITRVLGMAQMVSGYGTAETCGAVARTRWDDSFAKRSTTHGRPVRGMALRIVDLATGQTLPSAVVGEICVRGATMMRGYAGPAEEARRGFDAEGWFHTGDLGELDADGHVVFRGRVDDMIKPGGFAVATQEIEIFLKTYPGLREAVVVGVPDERHGEVPFAFVQVQPGREVDAEALRSYCKSHVASYKVPCRFEFVEDWPMSDGLRMRKTELRARAATLRGRVR